MLCDPGPSVDPHPARSAQILPSEPSAASADTRDTHEAIAALSLFQKFIELSWIGMVGTRTSLRHEVTPAGLACRKQRTRGARTSPATGRALLHPCYPGMRHPLGTAFPSSSCIWSAAFMVYRFDYSGYCCECARGMQLCILSFVRINVHDAAPVAGSYQERACDSIARASTPLRAGGARARAIELWRAFCLDFYGSGSSLQHPSGNARDPAHRAHC